MPGNNVTTIQSVPDDVLAESLSFLPQSELLEARNVNRSFEESVLKNLKQRELTLVDAAAGDIHTIALMHDKQGRQQLFAWGNNNRGQLGLGDNFRRRSKPQPLDMGFLPHGAQITQVVAVGGHTLIQARTEAGESQLFAWGYNGQGQLGLGHNAHRDTPQPLDMGFLPHGAQITRVVAGGGHTLIQARTEAGESQLFAWGNNEFGQLGLGNNADRNIPQALDMGFLPHGAQITKLAAGIRHTLIQTRTAAGNSQLFAWGCNRDGQLGLGDNAHRNTPQALDMNFLPHGAQITQVAAGWVHTLIQVQTAAGEPQLFAWGGNNQGQLGLGDNFRRRSKPQPLDMGFLPEGAQITQLVAGIRHTLIQTRTAAGNSQLFAWGGNVYGQLGLDDNADRNTPQQLCLGPFKPVHHQLSVRQTERRLARLERQRQSQTAALSIAAGLLSKAHQRRRRKTAIAYHDKSVKKRQSRSYRSGFESATSNCSYVLSYFKVCGKKANKEWRAGYAAGLLEKNARKQRLKLKLF